jgi:serine/threonine protein kinase
MDETLSRAVDPGFEVGADQDACVGTVLSGRFTLVEELGGGGMGRVFKARDALLEEGKDRRPFVAVKVLSADFKRHPDSFVALQREVKRTRELIHENVIRVYELHRDGSHVYMSMELLEGRPLDALVRGEFAAGLPLDRARPIVLGIGAALQYGHEKKIVHSDLKPGNVFVCDNGRIKVLDFGIARPMPLPGDGSDSTLFDPGKRLGALTPAYAALEMFQRDQPDPRDDIYALACMTYELISGRHPFERKSALVAAEEKLKPEPIPSLSRPQWQAIRNGLALKRAERTATVKEFLEPFIPASLLKRHRKLIFAGAVAILGIGATVGAPYVRDWIDLQQIKAFRPEPPPPRADLSPQEKQRIDDFLYLADTALAGVTPDMPLDDFVYGLSEGVNSANDAVEQVFVIDPGNARGLALQQRIAKSYSAKAQALYDAGEFAAASALIGYGREVFYSLELYQLEKKICEVDPGSCNPKQAP